MISVFGLFTITPEQHSDAGGLYHTLRCRLRIAGIDRFSVIQTVFM